MAVKQCSYCKTVLSDELKFCSKCGMDEFKQIKPPECSQCKESISDNTNFCTNCGQEQVKGSKFLKYTSIVICLFIIGCMAGTQKTSQQNNNSSSSPSDNALSSILSERLGKRLRFSSLETVYNENVLEVLFNTGSALDNESSRSGSIYDVMHIIENIAIKMPDRKIDEYIFKGYTKLVDIYGKSFEEVVFIASISDKEIRKIHWNNMYKDLFIKLLSSKGTIYFHPVLLK